MKKVLAEIIVMCWKCANFFLKLAKLCVFVLNLDNPNRSNLIY